MFLDKGFTIRVAEERCLNQRHNRVKCDHCINNCPASAIEILNNHVRIDKDQCNGCGLCLSDCPTGAFFSNQWDETTIVREVESHGWKTTGFYCSEHPGLDSDKHDNQIGAVRLAACLGSISRGAWYELGLKTEIDLYVDKCAGCSMSKAYSRLEYNVNLAAEWLEASGHKASINFVNSCRNDPSQKCREIVNTGLKLTSRRDLFLSLIKHVKQAPKGVAADRSDLVEKNHLPAWQKRFARIFQENTVAGATAAFWPTINISDACVNCGVCTFFCPTCALSIEEDGNTASHHFTSGYCLDCRICEMVCTVDAISRGRQQVENPFVTRTIRADPVIECSRCGDMSSENEQQLCYWCRQIDVMEEELMHTYRNYFLKSVS